MISMLPMSGYTRKVVVRSLGGVSYYLLVHYKCRHVSPSMRSFVCYTAILHVVVVFGAVGEKD